jgi:hypothetical protein
VRPARLLARPSTAIAAGVVLLVAFFQLRLTPGNPPGLHRDEASIAYNAWTVSQHLRDQNGAFMPTYFVSLGDYKSPLFVYLLALLFRLTGPSQTAALELGAAVVFAAILLCGLLAWRRTHNVAVAVGIVVLGGLTPWMYELGRTIWETVLFPLTFVGLLLVLDWAATSKRPSLVRALPVAGMLAAVAYAYAAGRILAPLFALCLLVFAGRGRWRWLLQVWLLFAVALVPMLIYGGRHPAFTTARWHDTTFIQPGMPLPTIVGDALWNYVRDVSLWHWVVSGDLKPYIHTWGAGQLYGSVVVLAGLGLVALLRHRPLTPWWRFVLLALLLAPVPAALTDDRHHALRLVLLPVLLLVLAIPGLELLVELVRRFWTARLAALVLAAGVVVQFFWFLHWYDVRGPARTVFFEADVPALLDRAFADDQTVFIDYDDHNAHAHAWWYAASHHLPPARVVVLSDGGIPPPGSMVFGRLQACDYVCTRLANADESYWIARAVGPN